MKFSALLFFFILSLSSSEVGAQDPSNPKEHLPAEGEIISTDKDSKDSEDEESERFFSGFWSYLGGVRFGISPGRASVHSSIQAEGYREEVAHGDSDYIEYEIALEGYDIPEKEDLYKLQFYFQFIPKYIFQSIDIADFEREIPEVKVSGKETIPFVVTDFETGNSVDPKDPNQYNIRLSSWILLLKSGFTVPVRCQIVDNCHTRLDLFGGIHLVDKMDIKVDLGSDSVSDSQLLAFKAIELGARIATAFPKIHSALDLGFQGMYYSDLQLPRKLEFRGEPRLNEAKQIFERDRVFLDKVQFSVLKLTLGYTYLF